MFIVASSDSPKNPSTAWSFLPYRQYRQFGQRRLWPCHWLPGSRNNPSERFMASDPSDPNSCKVFKDVAVIGLVGLKDVIAVSSSSKVGLAAMLFI
jgi:hypothetical protein